jgi:hypothetical protein
MSLQSGQGARSEADVVGALNKMHPTLLLFRVEEEPVIL